MTAPVMPGLRGTAANYAGPLGIPPGWPTASIDLRSRVNDRSTRMEADMASWAIPSKLHSGPGSSATPSATTGEATPLRHFVWLAGGMLVGFLVPFVLGDRIGLQRDVYYGVYAATVVALFVGWSRDTGQSLREMCARRWKLAVVLGLVAAGAMAFIATRQDVSGPHPGGVTLVGSVAWRGVVYGAADGLLLSAFPILLVFAALKKTKLRKRAGGVIAVGAVAIAASMAMTAVYHAGYSDFRSSKIGKPVTGDLVWSIPTLATLNPIGAPIAQIGLPAGAVLHNYNSNLFLPPHH
jgi:hypothetical protein